MYVLSPIHDDRCIWMRPSPANQWSAIRRLVRPWEVADLIEIVPRWRLPAGHTFAASAAAWLFRELRSRRLRYISDPDRPFGYDHWCSPSATLERGGGDCDDLAILAASLLLASGVDAWVVVGTLRRGLRPAGHAWVDGVDELGGFHIEATSGSLVLHVRPGRYRASVFLGPDCFELAA